MHTWNRYPNNPQTFKYCAWVAIHNPVIATQTLGFPFFSSKTITLSLLETLYIPYKFSSFFFYKNLTVILKNSSCPELLNLIWIVPLCLMLLNLFDALVLVLFSCVWWELSYVIQVWLLFRLGWSYGLGVDVVIEVFSTEKFLVRSCWMPCQRGLLWAAIHIRHNYWWQNLNNEPATTFGDWLDS